MTGLPKGWDLVTIEDIARPGAGAIRIGPFGSALKKHEYADSGVRVLGIEDVLPNRLVSARVKYIPEHKYRELTQYTVQIEDLLVTNMGTVGRTCVVPEGLETSLISSHLIKVSLDKQKAWPQYISWALNFCPSVLSQIQLRCQGAIMAGFNSSLLKQLKIPLPPLPEQRRIAEILDKADALRAKRRAALAQLDTLTQSIFLEMFGDPLSNPRKWSTARFEDICERITVGIVVQPASYYVSEGVPALRSLNIKPGKILRENLVYVSKSDNDTKLAKTKLKAGDVVLVRSGQPGTAAVITRDLDGVNAIDLLIATPDRRRTDPTFLCQFFNSTGGRDLVLSRQRGQVQKHLNVGALNQAILPLPPVELQNEFAARVAAVEVNRAAEVVSSTECDALFTSLQHRAFRGEL